MAKAGIPGMSGGGGFLKTVVGWIVIAALVFMVINQPTVAASWVNGAIGWTQNAMTSIGTFISSISGDA